MEAVDMTKMSSKGQVVIPGDIRQSLGLDTGTKFVVWADKDTIVLKKVGMPSFKAIDHLFRKSFQYARSAGLKKSDIRKVVKSARNNK